MLNNLFNNGGCFNLTFIRERRTNWSFVSSLTAVIIFAFGQHNTARWFSFLFLSSFPRRRLLSVDHLSIYLSLVRLSVFTDIFRVISHHSWYISRSSYIIRDVFFAHFASSFSLHCLHCLFTFLAQNNQPFLSLLFLGLVILMRGSRGNRH